MEVVDKQKLKYGFTDPKTGISNPTFSYFFDTRTDKLMYRWREDSYDQVKGKYYQKPRVKSWSFVNRKNWKKHFKGDTTILLDTVEYIKKSKEAAQTKYDNYQDEYDLGWWKDRFYNRVRVGEPLSQHTIKQNKRIIEPYYFWCLENHPESSEMGTHIDKGFNWVKELDLS